MNDSRLLDALIFLLAALIFIKDREALESYLGNSPPQSLNTSHPPSLNTLSISIWGGSLHSSSQPNKANMNYLLTFSQAPPRYSTDANGGSIWKGLCLVHYLQRRSKNKAQDLQDSQRSRLCRTCSLVYRNSELLCMSPYRHRHFRSSRSSVLSTQSSSVPLPPSEQLASDGRRVECSPSCHHVAHTKPLLQLQPGAGWVGVRSFLQLWTSDSHSATATGKALQNERYRVKMTRFPLHD